MFFWPNHIFVKYRVFWYWNLYCMTIIHSLTCFCCLFSPVPSCVLKGYVSCAYKHSPRWTDGKMCCLLFKMFIPVLTSVQQQLYSYGGCSLEMMSENKSTDSANKFGVLPDRINLFFSPFL